MMRGMLDHEEAMAAFEREVREEGYEQGLEQGRLRSILELVCDGLLPVAVAAERTGMTAEQFAERAAAEGFTLA